MALARSTFRQTVQTAETTQCPGCRLAIGVARPDHIGVEIGRHHAPDGREVITVNVGRVTVHSCTLCLDGFWR
jgi:uncharacterized protein (DUF169 family)